MRESSDCKCKMSSLLQSAAALVTQHETLDTDHSEEEGVEEVSGFLFSTFQTRTNYVRNMTVM